MNTISWRAHYRHMLLARLNHFVSRDITDSAGLRVRKGRGDLSCSKDRRQEESCCDNAGPPNCCGKATKYPRARHCSPVGLGCSGILPCKNNEQYVTCECDVTNRVRHELNHETKCSWPDCKCMKSSPRTVHYIDRHLGSQTGRARCILTE